MRSRCSANSLSSLRSMSYRLHRKHVLCLGYMFVVECSVDCITKTCASAAARLRNKDGLLGQFLELGSCLPIVVFKQFLQLLRVKLYTIETGVLLVEPLMKVEVIAYYSDPPLRCALRCHASRAT